MKSIRAMTHSGKLFGRGHFRKSIRGKAPSMGDLKQCFRKGPIKGANRVGLKQYFLQGRHQVWMSRNNMYMILDRQEGDGGWNPLFKRKAHPRHAAFRTSLPHCYHRKILTPNVVSNQQKILAHQTQFPKSYQNLITRVVMGSMQRHSDRGVSP